MKYYSSGVSNTYLTIEWKRILEAYETLNSRSNKDGFSLKCATLT